MITSGWRGECGGRTANTQLASPTFGSVKQVLVCFPSSPEVCRQITTNFDITHDSQIQHDDSHWIQGQLRTTWFHIKAVHSSAENSHGRYSCSRWRSRLILRCGDVALRGAANEQASKEPWRRISRRAVGHEDDVPDNNADGRSTVRSTTRSWRGARGVGSGAVDPAQQAKTVEPRGHQRLRQASVLRSCRGKVLENIFLVSLRNPSQYLTWTTGTPCSCNGHR